MSEDGLNEKVKAKLEELRKYLQSHGGDLEFVEMEGMTVRLRLQGACGGCPHAAMTIKQGIENALREEVDPALTVERVT
ncbi:MAG: NifU family protein [Kiritimatiellae bacterium]|nr:NifU family protein [Kiritimatiellia bacterium]